MKRFAAQYTITGTGEILKRALITVDNNNVITGVDDNGGSFRETASTPFYNGVIVPGFVNCHCHLELSWMKGKIGRRQGLPGFIREVREKRPDDRPHQIKSVRQADRGMYDSGTQACVDICNAGYTFQIKEESPVRYINLLEIFGIDPLKAAKRISEIIALRKEASAFGTPYYITPHSLYSLSVPLLEKVLDMTRGNRVSSIHFMESEAEKELLENAGGPMIDSYRAMSITEEMLASRVRKHTDGIMELVTPSGNLILVHNTFISGSEIGEIMKRGNTYWCLCPRSNLYIENNVPPLDLLRDANADIVIGTDSLASNDSLNMVDELYALQQAFGDLTLADMIPWATFSGARAAGMAGSLGTIKPGLKPGLVLIENVDLVNLKLTGQSRARRLV